MPKYRSIIQAYNMIRSDDPDTALSLNYIRNILTNGSVPTIKAGVKVLVDMDVLYDFLSKDAKSKKED